jgi:hypothetical protein
MHFVGFIFSYYSDIYLEAMNKTTADTLPAYFRFPYRDSNWTPSVQSSEALPLDANCSETVQIAGTVRILEFLTHP